jgi:5-methylcytosine-specific restriction endonuclease McrA
MELQHLTNEDLLTGLHALVGESRSIMVKLLAYLGEVDARRLFVEHGCSSMYAFCRERLKLSEGEAQRRIVAARLARKFPVILSMVESGSVHLSVLELLQQTLTLDNHRDVLNLVAGKSTRAVKAMLSDDDSMRMSFLASADLRAKIDLATSLMRHRNPRGDLAVMVEAALELLIAKLSKERLGAGAKTNPMTTRRLTAERIDRALRAAVFARDGMQCTFIDESGRRCSECGFLEIDHIVPRARGGKTELENLRVLCRAHNRLMAERAFGRAYVEEKIHLRRQRSA